MIGADGNRAQRARMRVGCALVIHRDVEEPRGAEGRARGVHFLQMTAERFLALIEAEDGLKRGRRRGVARGMTYQRVIQAMADRPLEGLVKDPPSPDAVEAPQFRFQLRD